MQHFCLILDLKEDESLIAEYENYHQNIWPEIKDSILASGITSMKIYRTANRMCMTIEAMDDFSFEKKSNADSSNPSVQKWEELMWRFQQALPFAKPGEKWILMNKIFEIGK